jgi:predicted RecB family endonuclease
VRGDRVEIVVDTGNGSVREFEVVATKAGRRVEVSVARGNVEVSEVTRTGQTVRSARFMATRVVALVEHPAGDEPDGEPRTGSRRRRPPADQPSLDLG